MSEARRLRVDRFLLASSWTCHGDFAPIYPSRAPRTSKQRTMYSMYILCATCHFARTCIRTRRLPVPSPWPTITCRFSSSCIESCQSVECSHSAQVTVTRTCTLHRHNFCRIERQRRRYPPSTYNPTPTTQGHDSVLIIDDFGSPRWVRSLVLFSKRWRSGLDSSILLRRRRAVIERQRRGCFGQS